MMRIVNTKISIFFKWEKIKLQRFRAEGTEASAQKLSLNVAPKFELCSWQVMFRCEIVHVKRLS